MVGEEVLVEGVDESVNDGRERVLSMSESR